MRDSSSEILHLTHPKSVAWNVLFSYIASKLQVDLVPYSDWLLRLEATETRVAVGQNPALRLLDFYKSVATKIDSTEAAGLPKLITDAARTASAALRNDSLLAVGPEDAQKWLEYWKLVTV